MDPFGYTKGDRGFFRILTADGDFRKDRPGRTVCSDFQRTGLKVQLKGRLTFEKKYIIKQIFIAFPYENEWYLFDHDELLNQFLEVFAEQMATSESWT